MVSTSVATKPTSKGSETTKTGNPIALQDNKRAQRQLELDKVEALKKKERVCSAGCVYFPKGDVARTSFGPMSFSRGCWCFQGALSREGLTLLLAAYCRVGEDEKGAHPILTQRPGDEHLGKQAIRFFAAHVCKAARTNRQAVRPTVQQKLGARRRCGGSWTRLKRKLGQRRGGDLRHSGGTRASGHLPSARRF